MKVETSCIKVRSEAWMYSSMSGKNMATDGVERSMAYKWKLRLFKLKGNATTAGLGQVVHMNLRRCQLHGESTRVRVKYHLSYKKVHCYFLQL